MLRLTATLAAAVAVVLGAFTVRVSDVPTLPATPFAYADIPMPAHLTAAPILGEDNTPADNPITDAGATLGRVLFYDTRLSVNGAVSCASCHRQANGFSDPATLSTGFAGGQTGRHSMGLAFSRYYRSGHFFWDERAATLEDQVLMPIQDPVEMGMTLDAVVARVQAAPFYADLFTDAFGSPDVTPARISKALAQFTRSMVAPNSRYDQARAIQGGAPQQGPLPGFTMQENMGRQLFFNRGRCAQCHRGDLFVGDVPRNNGLDATITDEGAGGGRFKTSSLRNIAVTAPYMHDGRFATLEEVVEHYSTGIQNSPTLDPRLRDGLGEPIRFNFTDTEKAALVAFLRTLTDDAFLADERWSDPFDGAVATASAPDALRLEIAGANPVRGATRLRVTGADGRPATVEVFNAAGRRVAVAHDGPLPDGRLVWDPAGLAPGLYVLRLRVGAEGASRTVAVVR